MLDYIDIHAHLNFADFDVDRLEILKNLAESNIGAINVGVDLKTSREVIALACEHDNLWAIVGIHPHEAGEKHDLNTLQQLALDPKVVAIGECGLDYFRLDSPELKLKQQALFEEQIELAILLNKPLMLHIRDSYEDVLAILNNFPKARAHAHFFAGDCRIAKQFLDRGDTISVTGVITFANQYDEVIRFVPIESLLAETDCPFVSPIPFRGKRNEPKHVSLVVEAISRIKNLPLEEVREKMVANAYRVFSL